MNPRWIKDNIVLAGFGLAFFLAFSIVGWQYWQQQSTYRRLNEGLNNQNRILNTLLSHDPTPTRDTVDALDTNTNRLNHVYQDLQLLSQRVKHLSTNDFAGLNISSFATKIRNEITRMQKDAHMAKVTIPASFCFGFQRYSKEVPKSKSHFSDIAKQVFVIHELTNLLIRDGVASIDGIFRIEIEPVDGKSAAVSKDILPSTFTLVTKENYTKMPFEFCFTCDAKSLQKFINDVANANTFYVIRTITIDQQAITGRNSDSGAASSESETAPSTPRLTVKLLLDFIEFNPVKTAAPSGK